MKTLAHLVPKRLAVLALAGSVVAGSGFLSEYVDVPRLAISWDGVWGWLVRESLRLTAIFLPLVVGGVVAWRAERWLRKGIRSERWSQEELEPVRRMLEDSAFTCLLVVPILVWAVSFLRSGFHISGLFWMCMMPVQMISRLRTMVARPRGAVGGVRIDWKAMKPIRSEHWGAARRG